MIDKTEIPMIDKTSMEQEALAAALRPLGEIVAEIGTNKPLSAYTRQEVLTLVEVIVDAYQKHLLGNNISPNNNISSTNGGRFNQPK